MRRRFFVAAELSADRQREFTDFVERTEGLSWWHWIDNVWLLTTKSASLKLDAISDKISSLSENGRWVLLEIPEDITWQSGAATNSKGRKLSDWLHDTWGDD